ncbi:hypothetical protein LCGC14_2080250 [marine sediment metagenome]|uniref:Uncharacterized protein n=1 Tax=marine sediment metagenome TaxID=412755 RepID=A0A0F9EG28_9ZZZZ
MVEHILSVMQVICGWINTRPWYLDPLACISTLSVVLAGGIVVFCVTVLPIMLFVIGIVWLLNRGEGGGNNLLSGP